MHSAVRRNRRFKPLDVGVVELRERSVVEYQRNYRVPAAQPLQRIRVGGVTRLALLPGGKSQLLEKHNAELLRRTDVELVPCFLVDILLDLLYLRLERVSELPQRLGVQLHALYLHGAQNLGKGYLNVSQNAVHLLLVYFLPQSAV